MQHRCATLYSAHMLHAMLTRCHHNLCIWQGGPGFQLQAIQETSTVQRFTYMACSSNVKVTGTHRARLEFRVARALLTQLAQHIDLPDHRAVSVLKIAVGDVTSRSQAAGAFALHGIQPRPVINGAHSVHWDCKSSKRTFIKGMIVQLCSFC